MIRSVLAALVAVFLCLPAFAKDVALMRIYAEGTPIFVGRINIPMTGELAPFEEMSDCRLFFRWDEERQLSYLLGEDGTRHYRHWQLSCVGTRGAIHTVVIESFSLPEYREGVGDVPHRECVIDRYTWIAPDGREYPALHSQCVG